MYRARSRWRWLLAAAALVAVAVAPEAGGVPAANEGPAVAASGASPIAGCDGDQPGSGINFVNSEIEPWMSLNQADELNLIGAWQQDRWNNGGLGGHRHRVELRRRAHVDDEREHEVLDLHGRDGGERRELRAGLGPVGRLLAGRDAPTS